MQGSPLPGGGCSALQQGLCLGIPDLPRHLIATFPERPILHSHSLSLRQTPGPRAVGGAHLNQPG